MAKHIEKKVEMKCCKMNKHLFIPISWKLSQTRKSATEFMCQMCLITVEKEDIEIVGQCFHKEMDELSSTPK